MNAWLAIVLLAIVQGATEFLPVSSSGHLSLGHALFSSSEPALLVDVVLHVGTLVAVVGVYRKDVLALVRGTLNAVPVALRQGPGEALREPTARLAAQVVMATFVTAVIGLAMSDAASTFLRGPAIVGGFLLVNGVILWSSKWAKPNAATTELGYGQALIIGVLQGLAVAPGISRSGTTITGALHMGVDGTTAARFSFLLSIPAILGALVLQLRELDAIGDVDWVRLIVGALTAAAVGYVCLLALLKILNKARFHHFAWYCWTLGTAAIVLALVT